jgi:hypothetical protein
MVFEYLHTDLKRFMDNQPKALDPMLIKVSRQFFPSP